MAVGAAHANGRVNIFLAEHSLVVTGVADIGLIGDEELCRIRGMRIVAFRAAFVERGMDIPHREHPLVVAIVTKAW